MPKELPAIFVVERKIDRLSRKLGQNNFRATTKEIEKIRLSLKRAQLMQKGSEPIAIMR